MAFLAAIVATLAMAPTDDPPLSADRKLPTPSPDTPLLVPPPKTRFELSAPLPTIPGVMMDVQGNGWGLAQQTARSKYLQARILWIDATANLERVNSDEKISNLLKQIKVAGFNTVVFDIKPISGQVMYPSRIAPRLTEWKGRTMPADFDPLKAMVREARSNGLSIMVSLNAFSEGHRDFKVGPGYGRTDWQTVLYEPKFSVNSILGGGYAVNPIPNKMPVDDTMLGVFNDKKALPPAQEVFYAVTINRNGGVVEALTGAGLANVNIPKDGSVLVGTGAAGNFLRGQAPPNAKLTFDTTAQFVPIQDRPDQQIPLMMNPNNPAVQDYELSILKEIGSGYDVDGVIYDDRMRYGGLNADFSPVTQAAFEKYVGRRISWPDDVFKFTLSPALNRGVIPGPYYEAWMTFRAQTIRNFMLKARQTLKGARPRAQFAMYAGSWYGDYQRFGNNYAAPEVDAGFWFLTPEYALTGTAPLLDFLITGCYYPNATIAEAMSQGLGIGNSVEAAGQLSNRMVRDQTWVYAGISLDQFAGNPEGLRNSLQAACGSTQGVMVFDLSHNIDPFWPIFRQAFMDPRRAPHQEPGLLAEVRKRRASVDKLGKKDGAVPIHAGSAGIGM
jgi:hypothetical protein